jgi:hypothetical protein
MRLYEKILHFSKAEVALDIDSLDRALSGVLSENERAIRFAVVDSEGDSIRCEVGILETDAQVSSSDPLFRILRRSYENTSQFNAVVVIPTGIGAEIGGHAGDAAPVIRLLSGAVDRIITHPNAVNASDINELPPNAVFVEGSVLTRLMMGTAALQPVRSNRQLIIVDKHIDALFVNSAINSVSAARTSLGANCVEVIQLDPPIQMMGRFTESGIAAGTVLGLERVCKVLEDRRGEYDAVALASVIDVPFNYHSDYFTSGGDMINPWGGVEAMLTHAISMLYNVPSAHSPMFESREIANLDVGIVDPRMAAEAVSVTFLHCILKGLHQSPRIVVDNGPNPAPGLVTSGDVSCVVIPDGCLGLPTLAALEQGIPLIAVKENRNLMKNDLSRLPWAKGQFTIVENYLEAAGVIAAMRQGVAVESVRRPIGATSSSIMDLHHRGSEDVAQSAESRRSQLEGASDPV